jgi:hypothetical protein
MCFFFPYMQNNSHNMRIISWKKKKVESMMPASYLRRVGYLNWGGYGVLDITDDDGDDGTGVNAGVRDEIPLDIKPKSLKPDISKFESAVEQGSVQMVKTQAKPKSPPTPPAPAPPAATRNSVLARLEALKAKSAAPKPSPNNNTTPTPPAATTSERSEEHFEESDDIAVL